MTPRDEITTNKFEFSPPGGALCQVVVYMATAQRPLYAILQSFTCNKRKRLEGECPHSNSFSKVVRGSASKCKFDRFCIS